MRAVFLILLGALIAACQPVVRQTELPASVTRLPFNREGAFLAQPLLFPSTVPSYVTFAPNTARLDTNAIARLNQQARYMKANPAFFFQLFGHSDVSGPDGFNRELAFARAQTARQYLLSVGVSRQQLLPVVSKGAGEQLDIDVGSSSLNRRVVTELYNPL